MYRHHDRHPAKTSKRLDREPRRPGDARPDPHNPSLSLKKRLKRAAFFDQRDREAAAGKAVPVDPDAGLPEQMVEDIEALERPSDSERSA